MEQLDIWMLLRYRKLDESSMSNKYYRKVMNFFKFIYFFNISSVLNANGFLESLPYDIMNYIREIVANDSLMKFRRYFEFLSISTSQEMIYHMDAKM